MNQSLNAKNQKTLHRSYNSKNRRWKFASPEVYINLVDDGVPFKLEFDTSGIDYDFLFVVHHIIFKSCGKFYCWFCSTKRNYSP